MNNRPTTRFGKPDLFSLDLDTLKKYSSGELSHKKFLAVHEEAGELLDLLYANLGQAEHVVSVQDWNEPKRVRKLGQYAVLKTMLLFTPFALVVGTGVSVKNLELGLLILGGWLLICSVGAIILFFQRLHVLKSKEGKSVLVITNRRMMRVWLDGSETVQAWRLGGGSGKKKHIEAVPELTKLMIELDLGKPSMN